MELKNTNRGKEQTLYISNGEEVIDITLRSHAPIGRLVNWRVSDAPLLSDQRQITFGVIVEVSKIKRGPNRNPTNTNWTSFTKELERRINKFPCEYQSEQEVDHAAEALQDALTKSYKNNCPIKTGDGGNTPWWNSGLGRLRENIGRSYNRAKHTGTQADWRVQKSNQRTYQDRIR